MWKSAVSTFNLRKDLKSYAEITEPSVFVVYCELICLNFVSP